jgi:hypothetical protein
MSFKTLPKPFQISRILHCINEERLSEGRFLGDELEVRKAVVDLRDKLARGTGSKRPSPDLITHWINWIWERYKKDEYSDIQQFYLYGTNAINPEKLPDDIRAAYWTPGSSDSSATGEDASEAEHFDSSGLKNQPSPQQVHMEAEITSQPEDRGRRSSRTAIKPNYTESHGPEQTASPNDAKETPKVEKVTQASSQRVPAAKGRKRNRQSHDDEYVPDQEKAGSKKQARHVRSSTHVSTSDAIDALRQHASGDSRKDLGDSLETRSSGRDDSLESSLGGKPAISTNAEDKSGNVAISGAAVISTSTPPTSTSPVQCQTSLHTSTSATNTSSADPPTTPSEPPSATLQDTAAMNRISSQVAAVYTHSFTQTRIISLPARRIIKTAPTTTLESHISDDPHPPEPVDRLCRTMDSLNSKIEEAATHLLDSLRIRKDQTVVLEANWEYSEEVMELICRVLGVSDEIYFEQVIQEVMDSNKETSILLHDFLRSLIGDVLTFRVLNKSLIQKELDSDPKLRAMNKSNRQREFCMCCMVEHC